MDFVFCEAACMVCAEKKKITQLAFNVGVLYWKGNVIKTISLVNDDLHLNKHDADEV